MFERIKQIMGANDPDEVMEADLRAMMERATKLVQRAGEVLAGNPIAEHDRERFYATDRELNTLEQKVRRQVISRVTVSSPAQRTRLLGLLALVHDIERLGDYAKNILEVAGLMPADPASVVPAKLGEIRAAVEAILEQAHDVLSSADEARTWTLLDRGHQVSQECDRLVENLARSEMPSSIGVPCALAGRYYKRVAKHLMNLLSSVVMPLDRVGYYDSAYRA